MDIKKGQREKIIKDTHIEYSNLYKGKYVNIYLNAID